MLHRIEGIVIRSLDYGESNKIVHLLTPTMGKISIMAAGAKKIRSRYSAVVQMFTHGDFVIYKSKQMGTLNHGEIINSHVRIREDLFKAAYASYLAEMIDRILAEEEVSGALFTQFNAALAAIEEGKDAQMISHVMEMKMLALSGYLPDLQTCASCGCKLDGNLMFSLQFGGLLCSNCMPEDSRAFPLLLKTLSLLQLFQHLDLTRLGTIQVQEKTRKQIKRCMQGLMDLHIGIEWKSQNFINQMNKYGIE